MNSVIALEELIKENKERIKHHQKQIADHESGECKLSRLSLASAETNLETAIIDLEKYQTVYDALSVEEKKELEEKAKIEEAIKRKKYFDNQVSRIRSQHNKSNEEKLEAMLILDELSHNVQVEDEKIFEIVEKSLELNITDHQEIFTQLQQIQKRFDNKIKHIKNDKIKELDMLRYEVPIIVTQFLIFHESLLQSIDDINERRKEHLEQESEDGIEYELLSFKGYPKYEDWWIHELWNSHQAYFALYKWKQIISNLCMSATQKASWEHIFDAWLTMKRHLNDKSEMAFEIHYAFDHLLCETVGLEEELEKNNLMSMETIIKKITQKEDFQTVSKEHNIVTPYLEFKRALTEQNE